MKTVSLALKNLSRNKRRNAVLAVAIAFGFFIVTSVDGLITGMVNVLEYQITQLVGGNVIVQGLEWQNSTVPDGTANLVNIVRDRNYAKEVVDSCGIKYDYYSCYTMSGGQLIFNGKKSVAQIYGRDLTEQKLRESMQFSSGGIDASVKNGIIISEKTAESLNVQVGDSVIYSTNTVYGQNTFADVTIMGITKTNTFISTMQGYMDIDQLNEIIEMPEGGYSMFSIYIPNQNQQTRAAFAIERRIRQDHENNPEINVTDRLLAMTTNPTNIGKGLENQLDPKNPENEWKGVMYGVETLYDEIPQLKTVLFVVHVITTVILIVILLIVMVGVSNTYRMVLYERIREIGTMRALGMTGSITRRVFTNEAVILCLIGAVIGLVTSIIAMYVVHMIPIHSEALSFFLEKEHLTFKVSAISIVIQYILLMLLTALAVCGSAHKASKMNPAEALRTIK